MSIHQTRQKQRSWITAVTVLALVAGCIAGCEDSTPGAPGGAGATITPTSTDSGAATSQPTDGESKALTLTDDMGRTVEVPVAPQRVAACVPFAVEMLYDLGHPPIVRPDRPVRPKAAEALPQVAVTHNVGPNLEQLAAAEPDLVVLSAVFAQFADPIQQNLGVPVLVYAINDVNDIPRIYRAFGTWLNEKAKAEEVATAMEQKLAAYETDKADGPRVMAVFGVADSFFTFLPDSYLGSMVDRLGGSLITEGLDPMSAGSGMAVFSMEVAIERDPDIIIVVRHGPEIDLDSTHAKHAAWADLRAVKAGNVHQLNEALYVSNPGPSAPQAMDELAKVLYGDDAKLHATAVEADHHDHAH